MRDMRDPQKLGELLVSRLRKKNGKRISKLARASVVADTLVDEDIPDYDAEHMGPIAKYGDPRKLPTTDQTSL